MTPQPPADPAVGERRARPRGHWLRYLTLLVGCGLMALLVAKFGVRDAWQAIRHANPLYLGAYLICAVAIILGSSARSFMVARTTGNTPPFRRFFTARLAGDAAGGLLPGGKVSGDPLRAAMLYGAGAHGVDASSWIVADRLMEVIGNTLAALAYVAVFTIRQTGSVVFPIAVSLVAGLVGVAGIIAMIWSGRRPVSPLLQPLVHWFPALGSRILLLAEVEDQLQQFFRLHARVFLAGVVLSLAIEAVVVLEYGALFRAFGLALDLPTLMLALLATGLARAVPTPAGLGAIEAGQVAAISYGIGRPDLGFVAGVVLRLHETLWMAVGALALLGEQGLHRSPMESAPAREKQAYP